VGPIESKGSKDINDLQRGSMASMRGSKASRRFKEVQRIGGIIS